MTAVTRSPRPGPGRPSPALVVACIALLVALSGTGYAAITLPRDSVGTAQLRDGAVTSQKIRDASVSTADLSPAARRALRGRVGPQGPAGHKGDKGDKGDPGPVGIAGVEWVWNSSQFDSSPEKTLVVSCPANKRLIGGGAAVWRRAMVGVPAGVALAASKPLDDRMWIAVAREVVDTDEGWFLQTTVVCAAVH